MKLLLVSIAFFCVTGSVASGQVNGLHMYAAGGLTLCKGCGHGKSDGWRGIFRIENSTSDDMMIYGWRPDGKFDPYLEGLHLNSDICEWQHGNGRTQGITWEQKSSMFKEPYVLKSKQIFEAEAFFDQADFNHPMRFSVFASDLKGSIPEEVYSDPYKVRAEPIFDRVGKLTTYLDPVFAPIDGYCDPHCKLGITELPRIRGIYLGMSLDEFKKLFPKQKITEPDERNIRYMFLWDLENDIYDIDLSFFNDTVVKIEVQFESLHGLRNRKDFYSIVAEKLGLGEFWTPSSSRFECREFFIDVLPNEDPTISVWDKSFSDLRDRINDEYIRNMK